MYGKTKGFAGVFLKETTISHKAGDKFKFSKGDKIKSEGAELVIKDIVVSSNSLGGAPRVQIYFDYETEDGKKGSDDDNVNNFVKNYL